MKNLYPILLLLACLSGSVQAQNPLNEYYTKAQKAYETGDFRSYSLFMLKCDSIRPLHPVILQNLAGSYALSKQEEKAFETLYRLIRFKASPSLWEDADLASLKKSSAYAALQTEWQAEQAPILRSDTLFTMADSTAHLESVVFDTLTQRFFMGSVHHRMIYQRNAQGEISPFTQAHDSIMAILGIAIDYKRSLLWASSSATPEMRNYDKTLEGKSYILGFDLATGALRYRLEGPTESFHFFGDVLVDAQGTIWVSDSGSPILYRISNPEKGIETVSSTPALSIQGLALHPNGKYLYFSDYTSGVYIYHLGTQEIKRLPYNPQLYSMKGIDGLYFYDNQLIATHNGTDPMRVVAYQLNEEGTELIGRKVLENNHPAFFEPTLGMIHHDQLYFVANSAWRSYDKNGQPIPALLRRPLVFKMPLK
ncbi:hypothetical protein QWY31_02335 [Cytophagales bacterium LB-30]|uniref:SMP-30/Gluconolactonase/LRE-like region domain-containing protein n=1 Tax=Shiella aurantiaca TaxID=3058365 RepID=A0ABT8F252_9BACT|nr:hypothetical protein [Shiella aurantiaca]MDN4164319.1 hypothetical protein [Shiella aurantiaca]